jgi:hypothetical protein
MSWEAPAPLVALETSSVGLGFLLEPTGYVPPTLSPKDGNRSSFQNAVFFRMTDDGGRAIAQAVSRWLPTAAVRDSKPDLGIWDLWWDKVALGRFSPSTSVSPAIVVRSTSYSTITLMYHPGNVQ